MTGISAVATVVLALSIGTSKGVSPLVRYHPDRMLASSWQKQISWVKSNALDFDVNDFVDIQKYFIKDAEHLNSTGIDWKCTESLIQFGIDIMHGKQYTFQAMDSNGKPESGLMLGNVKWRGRYHECMEAHGKEFDGKWCALQIGPQANIYGNTSLGFFMGNCLPETCSERHLTERLQPLVKRTGVNASVVCPVQPKEWTAGDITSIVFFGLLLFLVSIGTLIDGIGTYWNKSEALTVSGDGIIAEYRKENMSVLTKVSKSFSLFSNTKSLVQTQSQAGTIDVLHGIRFLSITWIMLGHVFVLPGLYLDNFVDLANWVLDSFAFQVVANSTVAVDTFFCLSGLLVTYLTLGDISRGNGRINVLKMYLIRYLRLTPAYAMVILFVVGIFTKIGDGPLWPESVNSQKDICDKYWWTNLLYINNLYPKNLLNECFVLGWYLANDMQFFILAPIFIILLHRIPRVGVVSVIAAIIANLFAAGFASANAQEQPAVIGMAQVFKFIVSPVNTSDPTVISPNVSNEVLTYWSDTYEKPWCRIGPYLVGILTGYILHTTNCKIKMRKTVVACGWILAFAVNFTLVFGLWPHVRDVTPLPVSTAAFFNAISRPLWAVGVSWVVVACASGYGGPVNSLLSWKLFVPLSRLTYCLYLLHTLVISWWFASREVDAFISKKDFVFDFLSVTVVSLAAAYTLAMLVEFPMISLTKTFIRKKKEPPIVEDERPLLSDGSKTTTPGRSDDE